MVQPYKEKWLNILDTVLLSNLVAVSLLFGGTAYTLFGQNDDSRNFHVFLVHIFVLMPIIYAVVLGIYTLVTHIWSKQKTGIPRKKYYVMKPSGGTSQDKATFYFTPREPFLFNDDSVS